jgi:hypothetical protein
MAAPLDRALLKFDAACRVGNIVMKALKVAGAAIAAVVVVVALLLIIGIPSGFLTSQIESRVERETGYRLTIAGTTKVGVWPTLNVTLSEITLQDPKDRDGSNRVTVGSVQADMTLSEQRVVGPPANHRTRDSQPGGVRAVAA